MKKHILTLFLAQFLCIGLSSCGDASTSSMSSSAPASSEAVFNQAPQEPSLPQEYAESLSPAVESDPTVAEAMQIYTSGANVIDAGECPYGDSVTWEFYDNGTLVFSGQGDIGDTEGENPPWYVHAEDTKNVIVRTGITRLGKYTLCAFFNEIDTITLPNTLTSIGPNSISIGGGSGTWDTLVLPDSVSTIEENAFEWCVALRNITIPNSVTSIGEGAFFGCVGLKEITVPGSVSTISKRMFRECESLEKVTLEEGVTTIDDGAFNGCGLRELHLPASLTTVEAHAFCASIPMPAAPGSAINAVYYNGTQDQWNAVNVDNTDSWPDDPRYSDNNDDLINATFYFNAP